MPQPRDGGLGRSGRFPDARAQKIPKRGLRQARVQTRHERGQESQDEVAPGLDGEVTARKVRKRGGVPEHLVKQHAGPRVGILNDGEDGAQDRDVAGVVGGAAKI